MDLKPELLVSSAELKGDARFNTPTTKIFIYKQPDNAAHDLVIWFQYLHFNCFTGYNLNGDFEILSFITNDPSKPITKDSEAQRDLLITLLSPSVKQEAQTVLNQEINKSNIITK